MPALARKQLVLKKETKGAVLYEVQNGNGGMITSIYLRKQGFPTNSYPSTIHVTVEVEDLGEGGGS